MIDIISKGRAYFYLVLTTAVWGSLYVVVKYIVDYIPPITLLLLRYAVAGLLLFVWMKRTKPQKIERKDYKYIFGIGALGYFGSIAVQLLATPYLSAGLASLVNSLGPIFILIFAVPMLKEKITAAKLISVVAALLGVYIIVGKGEGGNLVGIALSLISVILWSLTTIAVKRFTEKYDPLVITTYSILVALACAVPFSVLELSFSPRVSLLHPSVLIGLVYLSVICTAFTNVLWNKSLTVLEAGRCSLFFPIQPVVSAAAGAIFLKETVGLPFVAGAACILGGVLFSVLYHPAPKDSPRPPELPAASHTK